MAVLHSLLAEVDGKRHIVSNAVTWASARSGSSLDVQDYNATYPFSFAYARLTASFFIYRTFVRFNTNGKTGFDYAKLKVRAERVFRDWATYPNLYVVSGQQSDPIVTGNWASQNADMTVLGYIDVNQLTLETLVAIDIDITKINTSGWTRMCLLAECDALDKPITSVKSCGAYLYEPEKGSDYGPILELGTSPKQYPSSAMARVSSIRHIFRPGMFRMQVGLGDLGLDIDIAEATVRKELDIAPPTEPLYVGPGERGEPPRRVRAAPTIAPFDFDIPEDIGVSAKVTGPEPITRPTLPSISQAPSPAQRLSPWREEEGETLFGEITKGLNLLRERLRSIMRRGAQPNTCPICEQSFATATELQSHMRQRHGGM